MRMFTLIAHEWSTKSILPPMASWAFSNRAVRSSTDVASAGMMVALVFLANSSMVPMRQATAVLVNTICAPSSTTRSATFHAIDASFNAPKMIPRFPFNKLKDIMFYLDKMILFLP